MRKKKNFAPLKSILHRPTGPRKSPQLEFVEVRNCHCCCRLLHLNPMAVYRLLLSWANAELSSKGVAAKRQNCTSFGSAETKNNKCTTRQPALAKTLTVDELSYLKEQFVLLEPNKSGTISLDNVKAGLTKSATDAMKESHVLEFLTSHEMVRFPKMTATNRKMEQLHS